MGTQDATTRRGFVARMAGLAAALVTPRAVRGSIGHSIGASRDQEALPTRSIAGGGETLPVVGFGSSKPVLEIPTEGTEPVAGVIRTLLARGGRVVDTSPRTPEIDAELATVFAAPEFSGRLFISTKINADDEATGIRQMRQNRSLVGGRALDLLQIESLRGLDAHWPNLLRWKDSGEARRIGVTTSSIAQHGEFEEAMRLEGLDFAQINYSVMEPEAEERLLPLARDLGLGVLINRPFMNGGYFGRVSGRSLPAWASEFDCASWAQFSLKYILAHPAVTCVLTETTNSDHMAENIGAAFGRLPDEATKRRMRDLVRDF